MEQERKRIPPFLKALGDSLLLTKYQGIAEASTTRTENPRTENQQSPSPEQEEIAESVRAEKLIRDVGRKIKLGRSEHGWSQRQLAEKIGTSQSYIYRLENGQINPTIRALDKIANELKRDVEVQLIPKKAASND